MKITGKKTAIIAASTLALALALPTMALAAGPNGPGGWGGDNARNTENQTLVRTQRAAGNGYVDADGDGVCDNHGAGIGHGNGFVDADGDGVCDNYGTGQGAGSGYVDADGDGVCDNRGIGGGAGHGNGAGRR